MDKALQYLEKAYIEETASRLRSEGYAIEQPAGSDGGVDIIASKGGHKIAVQVKARPSLRASAKEIGKTRDDARSHGFDEFRLVVVNPPHDREVTVDGLEGQLRSWIEKNPGPLASLSEDFSIKEVVGLDLSQVGVDKGRIRVVGVGSVLVECVESRGEIEDQSWITDFPMTFDVTLTHELVIESVQNLFIDISNSED
jgi:hypothetical protein